MIHFLTDMRTISRLTFVFGNVLFRLIAHEMG